MRGITLFSQAKHLTVNIMRQQINYQRNLLKYEIWQQLSLLPHKKVCRILDRHWLECMSC